MRQHLVGAGTSLTQKIKDVMGCDECIAEYEDIKKSDRVNSAGRASICMFFAIFCRCHQTIFFEDFTKIIYVAIANKLGDFHERIVGI